MATRSMRHRPKVRCNLPDRSGVLIGRLVETTWGTFVRKIVLAPLCALVTVAVAACSPSGPEQTNPELAHSFFDAGPRQTREMLGRFFARSDIDAQLRDNVARDLLPSYLIQCVMGDPFSRFLFDPANEQKEEVLARLHQRLELFYQSVLKNP